MFRAPTQTPPISYLLDDLHTRDLRRVARHLGIAESTLKGYIKAEQAPRAVMLALFWETRWGYSYLDMDWDYRMKTQEGLISALKDKVQRLETQLRQLLDQPQDEAANAPLFEMGRIGRMFDFSRNSLQRHHDRRRYRNGTLVSAFS